MKPSRSVTQSPSDRRASASRFVYCEQTIKNVFQLHGADAQGRPVLKRKLARELLRALAEHPRALEERTAEVDRRLVAMAAVVGERIGPSLRNFHGLRGR